jgi:hypothetical protein
MSSEGGDRAELAAGARHQAHDPAARGDLLVLILNSFTSAVLSTVLIALFAALYRALAPSETNRI